jgi:hypothetical protein
LAAVLAAHGVVVQWLADRLVALDARQASRIPRMQAAYVRELRPTPPPAAPPAPAPRRAPRRPATAPAPAAAASQAGATDLGASAPAPSRAGASEAAASAVPAHLTASASPAASAASGLNIATAAEPGPSVPSASAPAVKAAASERAAPSAGAATATLAAASDSAPAVPDAAAHRADGDAEAEASFAWPASTRIRYVLTGQFRGEVHGSAEVQWLREGERYQVHLEAMIGPRMAPLGTRRMTSAGRVTPGGLQPEGYEQETRMLLAEPRQLRMAFDAATVLLANGTRLPRTPAMHDLQDIASQFVQLVWLFRTQPAQLQLGSSIEFPLALPRRVQRWTYDVVDRTTVPTPAGPVEAFHVKPRRDAAPGELTTEMWFAPALQYLPVRLLIRQDPQTYVDLAMQGLPEQAER